MYLSQKVVSNNRHTSEINTSFLGGVKIGDV